MIASRTFEDYSYGPYTAFPEPREKLAQFWLMRKYDPSVGLALKVIGLMLQKNVGQYHNEDEPMQEFIGEQLDHQAKAIVRQMLSALWAGFSVCQKRWATDAEQWRLDGVELLHPLTFFSTYSHADKRKGQGIRLDPKTKHIEEFVQYPDTIGAAPVIHRPQDVIYWPLDRELREQVLGQSLLDSARRAWYSKVTLERFWNTFCERHACPTPFVRVPQGSIEDDDGKSIPWAQWFVDMWRKHVVGDMVAIPGDPDQKMDIDSLAATGDGKAFDLSCRYWDAQLFLSVLTPQLLFKEPEHASRAQTSEVMDMFLMLLEGIQDELGDVLVDQIAKSLIVYNRGEQEQYGEWGWEPLRTDDLEMLSRVFEGVMRAYQAVAMGGFALTPADEAKHRELFSPILASMAEAEEVPE